MNKLEEMGSFFDSRLEEYDRHQLTEIEGAGEFYRFTAECLPAHPGARILDLGCGTGLELEEYFRHFAMEVSASGFCRGIGRAKHAWR